MLRIRIIQGASTALLTYKSKTVIQDGIGKSIELEEPLPVDVAKACILDPSVLFKRNRSVPLYTLSIFYLCFLSGLIDSQL